MYSQNQVWEVLQNFSNNQIYKNLDKSLSIDTKCQVRYSSFSAARRSRENHPVELWWELKSRDMSFTDSYWRHAQEMRRKVILSAAKGEYI